MTVGTCKHSGVDRVANNSAMYDHLNCRGRKKKKKRRVNKFIIGPTHFLVVVSRVEANE